MPLVKGSSVVPAPPIKEGQRFSVGLFSCVLPCVRGGVCELLRTSINAIRSRFGHNFLSPCHYSLLPLPAAQPQSPHVENFIPQFFNKLHADELIRFDMAIGWRRELHLELIAKDNHKSSRT